MCSGHRVVQQLGRRSGRLLADVEQVPGDPPDHLAHEHRPVLGAVHLVALVVEQQEARRRAAVAQRLANPSDRVDLLAKLQDGRDDNGDPMGREELTAEALTQLIAGSDTTSK